MSLKTIVLTLTSSVAIDGVILRAGKLVEVAEADAKALLRRGKAELATVEADVKGLFKSKSATAPAAPAPAAPTAGAGAGTPAAGAGGGTPETPAA